MMTVKDQVIVKKYKNLFAFDHAKAYQKEGQSSRLLNEEDVLNIVSKEFKRMQIE